MLAQIISDLKQTRAAALLIAAVAAVVSKKVIKTELVPEQLHWLSDAGVLAAMAALAAMPAVDVRPQRRSTKILIATMFLAFCAVIAIRTSLTEEIEINGENSRYLVGIGLTDYGKTSERNCLTGTKTQNLSHLSRYDLVKCAGAPYIPDIYGKSYVAVSIVYLVSYLSFLGIFVLLVGGATKPEMKG